VMVPAAEINPNKIAQKCKAVLSFILPISTRAARHAMFPASTATEVTEFVELTLLREMSSEATGRLTPTFVSSMLPMQKPNRFAYDLVHRSAGAEAVCEPYIPAILSNPRCTSDALQFHCA